MTADKPGTEPGSTSADTNVAPVTAAPPTAPDEDLSSLTRDQLEARVKALTESVSHANTDAEFFRRQWQELKLRDEALGVDALTVDERKLEDEKVQAIAELYHSEMHRRESLQILDRLLNSTEKLLQTAPNYDPKTRADYEVAVRSAKEYLAGREGSTIPIGVALSDGQIADFNPKLNAVIVNLGKSQGVKEGMPFLIFQQSQPVGSVKIVMTRELVSAGLVENLKPNVTLKVGDRVAVDARQ